MIIIIVKPGAPMRLRTEDHDLSYAIRFGTEPNEPRRLADFLAACDQNAERLTPNGKWCVYREAFDLLLDAICDCAVPTVWRQCCLDVIHQPLSTMRRLAVSDRQKLEVSRARHALRLQATYFLP